VCDPHLDSRAFKHWTFQGTISNLCKIDRKTQHIYNVCIKVEVQAMLGNLFAFRQYYIVLGQQLTNLTVHNLGYKNTISCFKYSILAGESANKPSPHSMCAPKHKGIEIVVSYWKHMQLEQVPLAVQINSVPLTDPLLQLVWHHSQLFNSIFVKFLNL